jgi:protein-tyrosine kinase
MSEIGASGKGGGGGATAPEGGAGVARGAAAPTSELVPVIGPGHAGFRSDFSTALRVTTPGAPAWMATTDQFESFRELRTRLLDLGSRAGHERFTTMVVPMTARCGGSFVARNLAAALTLQQRPSLLIECNFRGDHPDDGFGPGRDAQGLFDFLSEGDDPSTVVPIWPTMIRGLNVIPAGRCDGTFALAQRERLSSPVMKDLMAKVRSWPCHTFLDAPPVEGSPDARMLAELADLVVLVVGYGRVTTRAISQAAAMFDPAKFAGAVFNEYAGVAPSNPSR